MSNFFEQVYKIVALIPPGKVMSYGQIAALLGAPRAGRQVGWAMRACPDDLCWQRVVMKDGRVTGGQYEEIRRLMLEKEGVAFHLDGRVDMEECQYEFPEDLLEKILTRHS